MRHRQSKPQQRTQDRHVCCRHAGRPMLTARRWVWLASAVAAGLIGWSVYTDTVAESISLYVRCNTTGVTCYGYRDLPAAPPPAVPSSLGGSL